MTVCAEPEAAICDAPRPPSLEVACLLFEADNVLVDATLWRRWLHHLLARLGVYADYESLFETWDRDYLADVYRERREFSEAPSALLLAIGLTPAQIDEVDAASAAKRRELAGTTRPLPGVRSALWQLRAAGYRLGVLANDERPARRLAGDLERHGLGGLFERVTSSFDLDRTMPDGEVFLAALDDAAGAPDSAAFVSSRAAHLCAAAAVGLRTVALHPCAARSVDCQIDSLAEMPSWLRPPARSIAS